MTALGVFRDDYYNPACVLPVGQANAGPTVAGVAAASVLAGAQKNVVTVGSAAAAAYNVTTDTAANIVAALQTAMRNLNNTVPSKVIGTSFIVRFINVNATYAATIVAGAGVNIVGTATLALSTSRDFLATINGAASVTLTNIGSAGI